MGSTLQEDTSVLTRIQGRMCFKVQWRDHVIAMAPGAQLVGVVPYTKRL